MFFHVMVMEVAVPVTKVVTKNNVYPKLSTYLSSQPVLMSHYSNFFNLLKQTYRNMKYKSCLQLL